MFNMVEVLVSYISLGIAVLSILFVVWDHFKDDRLLTKRVQNFYNDIENLIFNFYMKNAFLKLCEINNANKEYEQEYFEYSKMQIFYEGRVKQQFEEYAKYLGLMYYRKPQYYMSTSNYLIQKEGGLAEFYPNINAISPLNRRQLFINSKTKNHDLDESSVNIINTFLKNLRDYWYKFHYKKVLRKKMKSKLDFLKLIY